MTPKRWRAVTEWPLAVASVMFLAFYGWTVIANLQPPENLLPEIVMLFIWGLFVLDFAVRFILSTERRRWLLKHIPELLILHFLHFVR